MLGWSRLQRGVSRLMVVKRRLRQTQSEACDKLDVGTARHSLLKSARREKGSGQQRDRSIASQAIEAMMEEGEIDGASVGLKRQVVDALLGRLAARSGSRSRSGTFRLTCRLSTDLCS